MSGPPQLRGQANRVEDVTDDLNEITQATVIDDHVESISKVVRLPLPSSMKAQASVEEVEDEDERRTIRENTPPPVITQVATPHSRR